MDCLSCGVVRAWPLRPQGTLPVSRVAGSNDDPTRDLYRELTVFSFRINKLY